MDLKKTMEAFLNARVNDETKNNLYWVDPNNVDLFGKGEVKPFLLRTDSKKDTQALSTLLNEHEVNLYYKWPPRHFTCVRLAVKVTHVPSLTHATLREWCSEDPSYAILSEKGHDKEGGSPYAQVQCLVRGLFSRLMDSYSTAALVDFHKQPLLLMRSKVDKHSYYALFQELWLHLEELRKLAFTFKYHPKLKDTGVIVQCGEDNLFPLPEYVPCNDKKNDTQEDQDTEPPAYPVNTSSITSVFLVPSKNAPRLPSAKFSQEGLSLYAATSTTITECKHAKAVQEVTRAACIEPFDIRSEIDLHSPILMNTEYLLRIFNHEAPALSFHYINQFLADCYKYGLVYMKVMDINTHTVMLTSHKRHKIAAEVFGFLSVDVTVVVDGKLKSKKINIIQFWLDHTQHRLYDNITFEPGQPTTIHHAIKYNQRKHNRGGEYLKELCVLNTCPPAAFFTYRQNYMDDGGGWSRFKNKAKPPDPPRRLTPIPANYAGHNFDFEDPDRWFGRQPGETPMQLFMRYASQLPTQILHSDDPLIEEKVEREGAVAQLFFILFHIYYCICDGDNDNFKRFHAFFARILLKPMDQARQFMVIQGHQGSGKTNIVNSIGMHCFGEGSQYHYLGGQSKRLVGRFSSQFDNAVLVALDEATIGKDEETMSALKSICTDRLRTTEAKYNDSRMIRNYLHVVFICNKCQLPVEPGDRRYIFYECNKELGYHSLYHSILQPRLLTRFSMMTYGTWLVRPWLTEDLSPPLLNPFLDNAFINFFKAPPLNALKEKCIMETLAEFDPELKWWEDCLKDGKIRKLSASRARFHKEMEWFRIHEAELRELGVWQDPAVNTSLSVNNVVGMAAAKVRSSTEKGFKEKWGWLLDIDSPEYHDFSIYSHLDADLVAGKEWPVVVHWDDLYDAFKSSCKSSKILPSGFIESIKGCVITANPNSRNSPPGNGSTSSNYQQQGGETVRLPCIWGARAQFRYFLKYNCVRDKRHIYHAGTHGYTQLPLLQQSQQSQQQTQERGHSPSSSSSSSSTHGNTTVTSTSTTTINPQAASVNTETWVTILHRQVAMGERPPGVHDDCQYCGKVSDLYKESPPENPVPEAAVSAGASEEGGVEDPDPQVHGLRHQAHGRGDRKRKQDSPGHKPPSPKGKGRADGSPPGSPLAGVQPGRGGLGRPDRARVQDEGEQARSPSPRPKRHRTRVLSADPGMSGLHLSSPSARVEVAL